MKKILSVFLSVLLLTLSLTGCSTEAPVQDSDHLRIVTTVFPEYDWVREIIKGNEENIDLNLLLKNGVDLHSYQPTTQDMVSIAEADVLIYVGGQSDSWVSDALASSENENRIVIDLFDVLKDTLKPLKETEGMEHHDHDHHHEGVNDEHVWLSLKRTMTAVDTIADQIAQADPDHASLYRSNADSYLKELENLDRQYQETVDNSRLDTVIFADRFPFFYMMDDYGVNYYAAFTGCSAESEASFETVAFLSGKVDELQSTVLLKIENCTHRIPETIIENTKTHGQKILEMNSIQSVTSRQIENGLTYLDVMKDNLEVLKQALQ